MDNRPICGMELTAADSELSLCNSQWSVDSVASADALSTPGTSSSCLFEQDIVPPWGIVGDEELSYILVVGGLGYIGSHTTLELLVEGYNVIVVDGFF